VPSLCSLPDLVFLGENLAPLGVGDDDILVPERRRLGTYTHDGFLFTSGGFCVPVVMPRGRQLVISVKVVARSSNDLRDSVGRG
jgi:hypothetical protein